jgi:hypothetical protein
MKSITFLLLISYLSIVSCKEPPIVFDEPQPESIRSINNFPSRYVGEYFSLNDSAILTIERNIIRKNYINRDTIPNQIYIDTLFALAKGDVLKKWRGYYFLNSFRKSNDWEVRKLKVRNGVITIGEISSIEDIEKTETIFETAYDTSTVYKVKPTKKQLKKFIEANGFGDEEIFVRQ